jgi:uncharacterized protein YlxW (UPF0749 family)
MKKRMSHITIALVCMVLGFMLTYEFKLLKADGTLGINEYTKGTEISVELETVKKQKLELEGKNNELLGKLKNYEDNITNEKEINNQIDKEIASSKILLGTTDVEGAGITFTIKPTSNASEVDATSTYITDEVLLFIVNELKFAGAEAISIQNRRITSRSGIRSIENNSVILINDERISAKSQIEIRAIGDKGKLAGALTFTGTIPTYYNHVIAPGDSIKIPKYNKLYKSSYLDAVK